ncbi:integrase [Ensifer sp. LBL]
MPPPLPGLSIRLGCTKTTTSNDDKRVVLIGRTVVALKGWLEHAGISEGPVFRRIDQWGSIDRRALTPQSVNLILKGRCKQAGLEPALFSAHGLRSGYLIEAARRSPRSDPTET